MTTEAVLAIAGIALFVYGILGRKIKGFGTKGVIFFAEPIDLWQRIALSILGFAFMVISILPILGIKPIAPATLTVTETIKPAETEIAIIVVDTNSLIGWVPNFDFSNGSDTKNDVSITDNVIELAYDVGEDGYVVIAKSINSNVLLDTTGISFLFKGSVPKNSIEFKLILRYPDDGEDTTYGIIWNRITDTGNHWKKVKVLYSDLSCWWPEENCQNHGNLLDSTKVDRLEFVVSNKPGDDPGSGTVFFSDVLCIQH